MTQYCYGDDSPDFGGLFGHVGHFFSNAAKVAGREIGHVQHSVQKAAGSVGGAIGKVPVVGAPLHTVMNLAYHTATAPANFAVDVAIKGKRIDRAFMTRLNERVKDIKDVAPYAQMVVSTVPGIGQGASAALGTGLALANGQPIDKALIDGALSAVPGGPLAQMAAKTAASAVSAAARGEKFNVGSALHSAVSALPIPEAAKQALATGVTMTADIANGKKLDAAVADAALREGMHYLTPAAKKAFQTGLGLQTAAMMQNLRALHLPEAHNKLVESGIQLGKSLPAVGEARKLVGQGTRGFDLGHGLLSQHSKLFDVMHIRETLKSPADKMGFDMALASRIGLVAHPVPKNLSPAGHAGLALAHGIRGMAKVENKQAIMSRVAAHPSASVGAKLAVAQAQAQKETWPVRVVRAVKKIFQH